MYKGPHLFFSFYIKQIGIAQEWRLKNLLILTKRDIAQKNVKTLNFNFLKKIYKKYKKLENKFVATLFKFYIKCQNIPSEIEGDFDKKICNPRVFLPRLNGCIC